MALLSIFPSFTFLSFTFLFNLFCFSSLCQRVVLLNLLVTTVNPKCLLLIIITESRRSPVVRVEGGGSGGAMVLGKLVGQDPIALAVGAGGDCLDIFSLVYLFSFLSPSLGDDQIQTEILSQRAVKPKTRNQPNLVVSGIRTPVYMV